MKKNKKDNKKIRMTIDMSLEFYERFEELEELVDAPSKAQLVRSALESYGHIAKLHHEGWKFQVIREDGEKALVFFPGLDS